MNLRKTDKYTKYALMTIAIGIILRFLLASIYYPSGDACWHLSVSRFIANNYQIPLFEPIGRDVFWVFPLFHIIAAIFYKVFLIFGTGAAEGSMRFVSPIFGSASLFLIFHVTKILFDKKKAFYATFFMAFFPLTLFYSSISYLGSTALFFALLSIYLLLKNHQIFSAICLSIAILTKYIVGFIFPAIIFLIYIKREDNKEFIKNSVIFIMVLLIAVLPWLLRNYIELGNPVWPFFSSVFGGYTSQESFSDMSLSNLLNLGHATKLYLGFFGVPNGSLAAFSFINLPFMGLLVTAWLLTTFMFITPFIIALFNIGYKRKKIQFLIIWIFFFLIGASFYIINVNNIYARYFLSAVPAIAILWAIGLEKINKISKYIFIILILISIGFASTEFFKFNIAKKSWQNYSEDFNWVKQNTPKEAIFMSTGQCVQYNIDRLTLYAKEENIKKADYIWNNKKFNLESSAILPENILTTIKDKNLSIAYKNKKTGTIIYKAS